MPNKLLMEYETLKRNPEYYHLSIYGLAGVIAARHDLPRVDEVYLTIIAYRNRQISRLFDRGRGY